MANLTKEYFDKKLGGLENHFNQKLVNLDKGLGNLATKNNLEQEMGDLAGMIARRFDEVERKLDVKEKVERLEVQMKQVREALNL